jgi:tetratricopeptide (TPR) repeat protein
MSHPPPATYETALALARAGRLAEAADQLQTILSADGDHADGWSLLAAVRQRLGQPEAALACHREVTRLRPDDPGAHLAYGAALAGLGHTAEALAAFDAVAAVAPDNAFAHNNRANMLNKLDRPDEALAAADRALALRPELIHAWRHRGQALGGLGDAEGAAAAYREALARTGAAEQYDVLCDLGGALATTGRYDEALAMLDRAVALRPDAAAARFRRSELRLVTGDLPGGWEDYETRWRLPDVLRMNREMTPELLGRLTLSPRAEELAGRRVLVVGEQGVGDVIMFASLLPDLAAIAAQVTCVVDPRLVRLFARSLPGVTFAPSGRAGAVDAGAFEKVVALGSLAFAFRRSQSDFPGRPYLKASPQAAEAWRRRLTAAGPGPRVGVSWRGGVKRTRAVARSIDLDALPFLGRDDLQFVSLQYGDVADEIAAVNRGLSRPVLAFSPAEIDDFDELAGLIEALDLVVTVQTTVAHLTGALGRPGLVMIPRWPEWRYGLQGDRIAWYGSLRLVRQAAAGDWAPVLGAVARELDALAP